MKKTLLAICILCVALLSGCSLQLGEDIDTNTIQIGKDGEVTGTLVETFTESYYKIEELESLVNEEVSKYNQSAGDGAVTVGTVELRDDNSAKVVLTYKSAKDYENFNQKTLFVGTVSDAKAQGYTFDTVSSANGSESLSDAQVLEKGDSKVVITEEALNVKVSGKITYLSAGAEAIDNKTASVKAEELTYILYE